MTKVTVQQKQRVHEEQPTPTSSPSRKSRQLNAQTTPAHLHWFEANPPWATLVATSRVRSSCGKMAFEKKMLTRVDLN